MYVRTLAVTRRQRATTSSEDKIMAFWKKLFGKAEPGTAEKSGNYFCANCAAAMRSVLEGPMRDHAAQIGLNERQFQEVFDAAIKSTPRPTKYFEKGEKFPVCSTCGKQQINWKFENSSSHKRIDGRKRSLGRGANKGLPEILDASGPSPKYRRIDVLNDSLIATVRGFIKEGYKIQEKRFNGVVLVAKGQIIEVVPQFSMSFLDEEFNRL
jgi:hypothetical protein